LPAASKSRFTYNCCIHLEGLSSSENGKFWECKTLKTGAYLAGKLRGFFNIHPMYICSNGVYFCYMWGMLSTGNAQIAVGGRAQGNAVQTSWAFSIMREMCIFRWKRATNSALNWASAPALLFAEGRVVVLSFFWHF
jgi:hypothetical protein